MKKYKLSNEVIARIVQLVQEALMTGNDCLVYFQQMELTENKDDPTQVVLTEDYKSLVKRQLDEETKIGLELYQNQKQNITIS